MYSSINATKAQFKWEQNKELSHEIRCSFFTAESIFTARWKNDSSGLVSIESFPLSHVTKPLLTKLNQQITQLVLTIIRHHVVIFCSIPAECQLETGWPSNSLFGRVLLCMDAHVSTGCSSCFRMVNESIRMQPCSAFSLGNWTLGQQVGIFQHPAASRSSNQLDWKRHGNMNRVDLGLTS